MVSRMITANQHPVLLRGLGLHAAQDARPTLVRRSEIQFVDELLADMTEGGSFARLASKTINQGKISSLLEVDSNRRNRLKKLGARTTAPVELVKLYQPMHRTFQFVVVEAVCDMFPELGKSGQPRLEREQIESAGLVVRRVSEANGEPEAWLTDGFSLRGWIPLNSGELSENMDPDPALRPRRLGTGVPELDAQLGLDRRPAATLFEIVEPLYVAPPDVCEGSGRTLLFGMVPTVSLEHSEMPAEQLPPPPIHLNLMRSLFRDYLTPAGGTRNVPLRLNPLGIDFYQAGVLQDGGDQFLSLLRTFNQLGALENTAAINALNGVTLALSIDPKNTSLDPNGPFQRVIRTNPLGQIIEDTIYVRLGDLVKHAAVTLRDSEIDLTSQVTTSSSQYLNWAIKSQAVSDAVLSALIERIENQVKNFKIVAGQRRFDPRRGRYQARAFIRVRREPGCLPELIWSDYSEVFQIAMPWDHNPDVPPAVIPMPDLPNRDTLKNLHPNVAFEVPEGLQNFLNANNPKDMFSGDVKEGSKVKLGILWVCSLNIYIIMMIAFVILFAFAFLLNIVFNWLIFIRICLPIPVPTEE
jgi:hypothetical protein